MFLIDWLPVWVFHTLVIAGVVAGLAGYILSKLLVFKSYSQPLLIAAVVALFAGVWFEGGIVRDEYYKSKIAELTTKVAVAEAKAAIVTTVVDEKIVEKVKVVKQNVYKTKEVIKYDVGPQVDAMCTLPKSVIRVHDAAADAEVPGPAQVGDDTPGDVKASTFLSTVTENYGTCNEWREQLLGWQEWYVKQRDNYNNLLKER